MNKIIMFMLFCSVSLLMANEIDLSVSQGTEQEVIKEFDPTAESLLSKRGANIKIVFDEKLKERSTKNSMKLRYLGCYQEKEDKLRDRLTKNLQRCETKYDGNKRLKKACTRCFQHIFKKQLKRKCKPRKVQGKTNYVAKKDLLKFNPNKKLKLGYYEVTVKGLKTEDKQKLEKIVYRFEVSKNSIQSLALSPQEITLNKSKNEIAQLKLQVNYKDGTVEGIGEDINWVLGDESLLSISADGNITALKQGETLVQAEYGGIISEQVKVTIVEVINGHTLPLEPDEALNNSTVLGIDSNGNEVRDDVERWIYTNYKEPLEQAVLMQSAYAYQKVIEDPNEAHNTVQYSDDALSCEFYLKRKSEVRYYSSIKKMRKIELNTLERHLAYHKYNAFFHGEILSSPKPDKEKCNFDVDALLGGE